ncbi:hypothetical protein Pan44_44970 [Caulifigura coniformis]|uniref:Sulfate exporter family transporter n=2 Tax=Caulifigura coniformis TaxID=2527983 RepID=A0A517SJY8_9PLAN|nr:hypothetical protein Pan44_44970 [Caulifigura coniformis]
MMPTAEPSAPVPEIVPSTPSMRTHEDWWSIYCGAFFLAVAFLAVWMAKPADLAEKISAGETVKVSSPLSRWLAFPGSWTSNPIDAFIKPATEKSPAMNVLPGMLGAFFAIGIVFGIAMQVRRGEGEKFLRAFPVVFLLAALSFVLAGQSLIKAYNLEYALWALLVGLVICNTIGTPDWLRPAVATEFYIKTGLVLLGAEVLMSRLLALGAPGVFVSWVCTPITLIATYIFGQRILKIESRSLNMVISADMSVCGVSAAIATAAACKAKKEELSLAIGLSLIFTVGMMVVMPAIINAVNMDQTLAGAWLGGTIDSTGAVAAAGALVGTQALETATTVKMIQNILIGVIAFGVSVYWVTFVERNPGGQRLGVGEIWKRFPRFIIGFFLASVVFSVLFSTLTGGPELIGAMTKGTTIPLRSWLFCLAFVSIGLETNFRELAPYLKGGKALTLYVVGQTLNLCLTLAMAWLMFRVIFREDLPTP